MTLVTVSGPHQQAAMPAVDVRRALQSLVTREGARAAGEMLVGQRAAGANMSVDIAAGLAGVFGDTVAGQGLYVAYNDAAVNLAVSAAHATLPRIDRVCLRVRDAFHGDAANDFSFVTVVGTATAGATLANLTGAAAVPANHLLLANVLVPAAAASIVTANIDATVLRGIDAPDRARAGKTAVQSIPNATLTVLTWDTETGSGQYDPDGLHDNTTNNSRLTAARAGVYMYELVVAWAANATGYREAVVRANGTEYKNAVSDTPATAAINFIQTVTGTVVLAAGGYIEGLAMQASGGALNVEVSDGTTGAISAFAMTRVGPS